MNGKPLIIRSGEEYIKTCLYGSSGNTDFDCAAMELMYCINNYLSDDLLSYIEEIKGSDVLESQYWKRIIGTLNGILKSRIQHVKVQRVKEHPHPEGEYYYVRGLEGSKKGTLILDGNKIDLIAGSFYYISPNAEHAVSPKETGGELEILVFKYSDGISDSFSKEDGLELIKSKDFSNALNAIYCDIR